MDVMTEEQFAEYFRSGRAQRDLLAIGNAAIRAAECLDKACSTFATATKPAPDHPTASRSI